MNPTSRRHDLIIGIDAGTSVIKSVAFDLQGRQIAMASVPNVYSVQGSAATQDMATTWAGCIETLTALSKQVSELDVRTAAIAVTGQGDGTWLMDDAGVPVGKAWLWLDARAADLVDTIRDSDADTTRFAASTSGLAACQQGPQLLAMRRDMPEVLGRASVAFHCKDWLYYKLTGERCTDLSEGCLSFGNPRTTDYDDTVIEALGLQSLRHLMPPMLDGTQHHHPLTSDSAKACGLRAGTPVILACLDVVCTAMGAGVFDPAVQPGCTILGSTGIHTRAVPTSQIILNAERTGFTCLLPAAGYAMQIQSNMAATLNLDWMLSLGAQLGTELGAPCTRVDLIDRIGHWMKASTPGALLYHPYISSAGERGPFVDALARASFIGLDSSHGYADLVRAVIEGLGLAAHDCYAAMGELPAEIRISGGAARSSDLRAVLAACLNRPVRTSSREEAGAAGAAMMAAVCIGAFDSMSDCVTAWVTPGLAEPEAPESELAGLYGQQYPRYKQAREALRPIWKTLSMTGTRDHV